MAKSLWAKIDPAESEKIVLEGISQKGKNKVRELGKDWRIVDIAEKAQFSDKPGPWYSIIPEHLLAEYIDKGWAARTKASSTERWINSKDDNDFKIVEDVEDENVQDNGDRR